MKIDALLILMMMTLISTACNNKKVERPASVLTTEQVAKQNQSTGNSMAATAGISADGTVLHYYCPNKCAGSGGDARGTCPVCGTEYLHNDAYHANDISTQNQTVEEPAQNAAGIWHYTCPQGCDGGSGSAVACAKCGTTLEHNQAYHN